MAAAPSGSRFSGAVAPWAQTATRRKRLKGLLPQGPHTLRSWLKVVAGFALHLSCNPVLRFAAVRRNSEETERFCPPSVSAVAPTFSLHWSTRSSRPVPLHAFQRSKACRSSICSSAHKVNAMPASPALPNPSLNLTRYGKRRKPGLQHASYPCSPGLRRSPPRAG